MLSHACSTESQSQCRLGKPCEMQSRRSRQLQTSSILGRTLAPRSAGTASLCSASCPAWTITLARSGKDTGDTSDGQPHRGTQCRGGVSACVPKPQ